MAYLESLSLACQDLQGGENFSMRRGVRWWIKRSEVGQVVEEDPMAVEESKIILRSVEVEMEEAAKTVEMWDKSKKRWEYKLAKLKEGEKYTNCFYIFFLLRPISILSFSHGPTDKRKPALG